MYKDTIAGSKVIGKLKPGDEVWYPSRKSDKWTKVSLQKFSSTTVFIKTRNLTSDTTIITHSSVLRDKYNQPKVAALDEKYDSIAISYLNWFPIKKANFWIYAIVTGIGIF